MKIYSLLIFLVFFSSLFSCDRKSNKATPSSCFVSEKSFRLGDFITVLPLDSLSNPYQNIRGYVDLDRFFTYNPQTQSIYTYLLEDSVWNIAYITKVPLDPANNFRTVFDIHYHNQDSIFIYDESTIYSEHPDLFLINVEGKIINSYKLLNVNQGEPMAINKRVAHSNPVFFYFKDKIYMAVQPNYQTIKDNWKPLLIFDLKNGSKTFTGNLRVDPENDTGYGQYSTSFFMTFNPYLEEFYISWAFDENIYRFRLSDNTWDTLELSSKYFKKPEQWIPSDNPEDYRDYLLNNFWFRGLYYEAKTKRIQRLMSYPKNQRSPFPSVNVDGLSFTDMEKGILTYSIDPENGEYSVIPFLNHLTRTFMFHPTLGALTWTQLNDTYGLNVEDFIVLAPIEIY